MRNSRQPHALGLTMMKRAPRSFARTMSSFSPPKPLISPLVLHQPPRLARPPPLSIPPRFLSRRGYQNNSDNRPPRAPELDLKSQPSEAMSELQKDQEIKEQAKKSGKPPVQQKSPDLFDEKTLSKAEQRKVNWGILKTLVKYIWPKVISLFRCAWLPGLRRVM